MELKISSLYIVRSTIYGAQKSWVLTVFFIDKESDDVNLECNMQESISYFKCDFGCQREVTLNKPKNTKHHPKSMLGPGTCGCLLFVRKDKHEEAGRKSWKQNASELVSQGKRMSPL